MVGVSLQEVYVMSPKETKVNTCVCVCVCDDFIAVVAGVPWGCPGPFGTVRVHRETSVNRSRPYVRTHIVSLHSSSHSGQLTASQTVLGGQTLLVTGG